MTESDDADASMSGNGFQCLRRIGFAVDEARAFTDDN